MNVVKHRCWLLATLTLGLLSNGVSGQTVSGTATVQVPDASGWYSLFDGKTLSGWKTFDPHAWKIVDGGMLEGTGTRSHLFSPGTYRNMEFRAQVKLNHKGNSGMYFRAKLGEGWPRGYETQVENTSSDPQRTGSLYNFVKVGKQLVEDDTWWTQHVVAIGNRTIIKVNDEIVVDFIDKKNTHTEGHLALQQHDPGSVVLYKNVQVKPLPDDEKAALEIVKKDLPELK
jgi:hypothetical protein